MYGEEHYECAHARNNPPTPKVLSQLSHGLYASRKDFVRESRALRVSAKSAFTAVESRRLTTRAVLRDSSTRLPTIVSEAVPSCSPSLSTIASDSNIIN